MANVEKTILGLRLGSVAALAMLFAAAPFTVTMKDGLVSLAAPAAFAKGSNSGSGGGGSDDSGGDDNGGDDNGGHHGGDDDDDDDDDDGHHSGHDDSGHHHDFSVGSSAGGGGVVKIERSASGIEVTFSDGSRVEIENGRYERKDTTGRTVEERPATQADFSRLQALN